MIDSTRVSLLVVALAACGGASSSGGGAPVANTSRGDQAAPACELPPEPPRAPPAAMCTEMACRDGYHVSLTPDEGWPVGQYTFEIVADGKRQVCTGGIPLADCGTSTLRCTGDDVAAIGELSCGGDVALQAFDSISFNGTPCEARITISRDGAVLVDRTFTPSYRWIDVNGPGCDPRCLQAGNELPVP
jgi:hypothetical protein